MGSLAQTRSSDRRLIRDAVEGYGGAVFGTEGDAVFVAFDRAMAARPAARQ